MPFNFGRGKRARVGGYAPQASGAVVANRLREMDTIGQTNSVEGMALGRSPMRQDLPGRRIDVSHRSAEMEGRMSNVLEARRQAKLASADPGLSGRGRVGAPGRAARPVTGGLEGRGRVGAPGRGARPVTGGLEGRGVRPAPGTRKLPSQNLPVHVPGKGYGSSGPMGRIASGPIVGPSGRAIEMGPASRALVHVPGRGSGPGLRPLPNHVPGLGLSGPRNLPARIPMRANGSGGGMPPGTGAPPPPRPRSTGGRATGLFDNMSSRNKLLIGAGAAVLAAAAYGNRRGEGTSSGRSGMARY